VSADTVTFYRVLLSLIGIGLSFGYYLYYLRDRATPKRIYTAVLILCAVFGLYLYLELGPQFQLQRTTVKRMTNPHDFYHYYIGSKYFRELGYFDLYECSAVADQQRRKALRPDWKIRDLRTYRYRTISSLADRPRYCQELFSAERWRSFGRDIEVLSGWLSPKGWNTALKDKGYNATPVWTMVAARFSNLVPLESAAGVFWLLSFDWVFSLAIFVGVGLAYGWRPALLVAVFFGLNSLSATGFVKGSFSRLDWLACLVLAGQLAGQCSHEKPDGQGPDGHQEAPHHHRTAQPAAVAHPGHQRLEEIRQQQGDQQWHGHRAHRVAEPHESGGGGEEQRVPNGLELPEMQMFQRVTAVAGHRR